MAAIDVAFPMFTRYAYCGHVFGNRVEQDMRRDVFDHLEKLPFSFFDTNRTGKIMSRATTDLFEITELAHHGPEDFSIAMLNLIGSFILLLTIRWELTIIVFIMLPLIFFIVYTSCKNLSAAKQDRFRYMASSFLKH